MSSVGLHTLTSPSELIKAAIIIIIIIIKQIVAQVKQIIVTNALCYQLPERNITVFKRLRNTVNDNEL